MSERVTVDVGAQYLRDTIRFVILGTGVDNAGPYALVGVGPGATRVRLRVGIPHPLSDDRFLHLAGIAPVGHRPAVALEITSADETADRSAP